MATKIFIMAGGTGGHVFPGIAIAQGLQKKGVKVMWLGSVGGMETTLVPKANLPLYTLSMQGFRGKSFLRQFTMLFVLLRAIIQAYHIFKKEKPDVVLGMGGFVAFPGGIAATLRGIPLVIHEQNRIAGWTNKILSRLASKVLCAFPDTFAGLSPSKYIFTGNPVREDVQALSSKSIHTLHHPVRVLILGGSRGAKVLNDRVPEAIQLLPANLKPEIVHQTGQVSSANYGDIPATVMPFIDDMAKMYDWADMVICRAGALTLAEITAIGLPAILIPYPYAVDDHQTVNADYIAKNSAAWMLPQADLTPQKLSELLVHLFTHPEEYAAMAEASRKLRVPESLRKITQHLEWINK